MPRKDAILKLRITEELKAGAERIAEATGETLSVIVRQALREYIDRNAAKVSSTPADELQLPPTSPE